MANSSSKGGRGFRVVCALILLFLTMHPFARAEDCPPCYYNMPRPNTAGNGTSPDGRPKLILKIDSSWSVPILAPPRVKPTRAFGMLFKVAVGVPPLVRPICGIVRPVPMVLRHLFTLS